MSVTYKLPFFMRIWLKVSKDALVQHDKVKYPSLFITWFIVFFFTGEWIYRYGSMVYLFICKILRYYYIYCMCFKQNVQREVWYIFLTIRNV